VPVSMGMAKTPRKSWGKTVSGGAPRYRWGNLTKI